MIFNGVEFLKRTVEDIKYALSNHFQGTPYDPYGKFSDEKGKFRPIGINRNNFLGLVQIRPDMPEEIRSIEWLALGSNVFNAMIPFYVNIDKTPEYLANTTGVPTTDDFYWTNRLVAALADAHYASCSSHIERYQLAIQSKSTEILNKYDNEFLSGKVQKDKVVEFCEKANEEIATELRKQTIDLLSKVLYTASCEMKNGFSRSDA